MNISQVDTAVKRLSVLDTYRRLDNEDVRAEYMQSLMDIDYEVFAAAFSQLKATYQELPTIRDVISLCRALQGKPTPEKIECELCRGTGLVDITEKRPMSGKAKNQSDEDYEKQKKEYVFSFRCFCKNGQRWGNMIPRIDAIYPGYTGGRR